MANLKISQLPTAATATTADQIAVVNEGVTSKITIQDIINLTPDVGFTGNTSGTCITDIFASNYNSCSPLTFKSEGQVMGTFTVGEGLKLGTGVNFVIPSGSEIVDGAGSPLVSEGSSSNRINANGIAALSSDYWGGDIYRTTTSGTTTATTATTKFETSHNLTNGRISKNIDWVDTDGNELPQCSSFDTYKTYNTSELISTDVKSGWIVGLTNAGRFTESFNLATGRIGRNLVWLDENAQEDSNCNELSLFTDYSKTGLIVNETISGSSSGVTGSTRYVKTYDLGDNLIGEKRYIDDGGAPKLVSQYWSGDRKSNVDGMFYQMVGGLDNLNRIGNACACGDNGGEYQSTCTPCHYDSATFTSKVSSFLNDTQDATLYNVNSTSVDNAIVSNSILHSDYSTQMTNQTLFDSLGVNEYKLAVDGSDRIKVQSHYSIPTLTLNKTISGSTTGYTGSTIIVENSYDLINGSTSRVVKDEDCKDCFVSSVSSYNLDTLVSTETLSGTSTGMTGTTVFQRQYNYDLGAEIFSFNNGTNDFRVGGAIDGCCVRATDDPEYCGPCDGPKAVLSHYRYDDSLNGTGAYFAEKYDFVDGTRRNVLHWGDADGNDLDCDVHQDNTTFSKSGLTRTDTISGYTTGTTGTTYIRKYDLGEGIDSYSSRKQEMTKDNVYQYSTGYKTASNSFSDFVLNTSNTEWLTTLNESCIVTPICDGSAVNIKSIVSDSIDISDPDNASYIIEGYNPLANVNYTIQAIDSSPNILVDYFDVSTGAVVRVYGTNNENMYYNHKQDMSDGGGGFNLIDRVTYSGVSTGYTGTTVVFREERDLIAGTKTTIINDVNKVVLTDLLLTSYVTIKSNNGNFNFGSLSNEVPSSPTDGMGNIGDMRIGGNNIYVKLANGKWGISTLSEAW